MSAIRQPDLSTFTVRAATAAAVSATTGFTVTDGVTPVAGDRLLVKDHTTPANNGIWLANAGAWTRPNDFGGAGLFQQDVPAGHKVHVTEGTANAGTEWVNTNTGLIVPGTTGLTYKRSDGSWDEWETLMFNSSNLPASSAAGTYLLSIGSAAVISTAALTGGIPLFHLDPAQYAVTGKTLQLRVVGHTLTTSTAPATTFTFGLHQITAVAALSPTVSAAVAGSTAAIATPAINTMTGAYGAAFTMPAAGTYVLAVAITPTMAAGATQVRSMLQMRAI